MLLWCVVVHARWGGDTWVQGVEHMEGFGEYSERYTYPTRCLTFRDHLSERSVRAYIFDANIMIEAKKIFIGT